MEVFEKPSVTVSQMGACFRRWWWRLSAHAIRKPSSVATGIGWRGWSTITPQSRRCPGGDLIEEWRSSAATHRYRKQLQKHHSLYQSQNWDKISLYINNEKDRHRKPRLHVQMKQCNSKNELPGPTETNTSEDDSVQLRSCAHLNIHLLAFG